MKKLEDQHLARTNEITAAVCEEMHLECTDYLLSKVQNMGEEIIIDP